MAHRRTVRLEDVPALTDLDRRCFPPDIAYSSEYFQELVESPDVQGILEEGTGGELIGFILWTDAREGIGHLVTVDVDPAHQGREIGTGLMDEMHARCKGSGVRAVVLEVSVANDGAIAFYRRQGYVHLTDLKDYYGTGKDALLLMKRI